MSKDDQMPREPSEEVREQQTEDYSEGDFADALDQVTRRLEPEDDSSEPGRGSPRRSARDRHDDGMISSGAHGS